MACYLYDLTADTSATTKLYVFLGPPLSNLNTTATATINATMKFVVLAVLAKHSMPILSFVAGAAAIM